MATKLPYLNVLEVESVNKDEVSRAIVIDKDEYVKALDIEQITTYQGLSNKPKINGVELNGDISLDELNVASKNDLNQVISDLDEVTSNIPTTENIQDKIDNSLMDYPTKSEVTTEINEKISNKADKSEIPTKVSQLDNDEGYLTTIPSEYVTESELSDKNYATEQWVEDKGYLTSIPDIYVTEDELNEKNYATKTEVEGKQNQLVSGTNIKTVNGESILGEGNIEIEGGSDLSNYYNKTESDNKYQLKGDYITPDNINTYLDPITQDITELETSKQETFQVNQPLAFSRSGEDLVLDVNLDNYATTTALNNKQDKLTTGDNINITDNVISWEAPNVQFVNTIFTDDESLKYAVSDFSGTYTEKEFPVATQESAGLMSASDKTKLDNLDGSGGSIPYLKVGLTSIVSGDFTAVYNAIENNEPYFLQVTWSGGEALGYFVNPETVWASNNTIYCTNQEHKNDGTYNFYSWTITAETVSFTSDTDNAIPYMQINNNEIVSGTFEEVYNAVKNNHPYFIKLYITGTTDYWGDPEMTRVTGNNLECWSTYHPVDGSYTQVMWTITPDGTVTKRVWELDLATQEEVDAKQDILVSGTNIKTINGNSILGEGDLVISGSGSGSSDYNDLTNKPSIEGVTLEGNLSADQLALVNFADFTYLKDRVDENIPYYLKCGTSTIISGSFDDVYSAIKNNKNYRIELMLVSVGSTATSYFGQPEVVRIEGDNIVCYASIHYAGKYQRSTWTISSTGVTVTSSDFNLVETETNSSSVPQVEKIVTLTQDEYDALSEYDSTVLYLIV